MSTMNEPQTGARPGKSDSSHQDLDIGDSIEQGQLQRRLNGRQIQLIAAGGSIGTAIFIGIGGGLAKGGPGSLLIAYVVNSFIVAMVNNSMAEMNTFMPVAGGFIRLAGYWVDDALGFVAGWNFFFYEAFLIPFEITALTSVISFWSPEVLNPGYTAAVCASTIVAYGLLNILAVRFYGESEFWLSGGKVLLIMILFAFTLVTMSGGNPERNAYGFRHFYDPGSFAQYLGQGNKGYFEGFLAAFWNAAFTVVGPEYISMVSAEAKKPSIVIKSAFKTVYWRFGLFFIGAAFCVGIVCAYDDPVLKDIYFGSSSTGTDGAAGSPYVIAMTNLGITGLPHVVNFLILTSIFSAGNTYTYCATRALYSLALEGRAPRLLQYCSKQGIPVYCFLVVMAFSFLSFLQLSSGSAKALGWFISITTGGGLVTFIIMSVTFINYYKACKVQGVNRKGERPYYGYLQPYCAYIALVVQFIIAITYGYYAFRPRWNTEVFFQNYSMQLLAIILFTVWKVAKKTHYVRPKEVDLVWERPEIDAYEAAFEGPMDEFWEGLVSKISLRRRMKPSVSTQV